MSDNIYAHDNGVAGDFFAGDGNMFQRVLRLRTTDENRPDDEQSTALSSLNEGSMSLFKTVRSNIVQSIRAFRVQDLADEASKLGQHFLYAYCGQAQSKQEVLEDHRHVVSVSQALWEELRRAVRQLTDLVHKAGSQPGFVIVLEALPVAQKFDKEGRETLLDVFREAAEFWAERRVAFRVFYSFA